LRLLGVTDVMQIPGGEAGTNGEGQALPAWCDQHDFRSIVFVASRDHSRRTRRVLNRVMNGHPTRVIVQPARYSPFDPDRWWETRGRADRNHRTPGARATPFCIRCHFDISLSNGRLRSTLSTTPPRSSSVTPARSDARASSASGSARRIVAASHVTG